MIALALLVSNLLTVALGPDRDRIEAPSRPPAPGRCDDGTSSRGPDGSPNWDCEIRGCSPHAPICWSDRYDPCFGESGEDLGVCSEGPTEKCESYLSCFDLWVYCNGVYQCHEDDSLIGCTNGSCTPVTLPAPERRPDQIRGAFGDASYDFDECAPSQGMDAWVSEERKSAREIAPQPRYLPGTTVADTMGGHGHV